MKRALKLIVTVATVISVSYVNAQTGTNPINVTTTAVPFLRISPEARAGGMGETGIATAPEANANFWNLAKTPFNESKTGIALNYTPWLKKLGLNDVYLATLGGYHKLDDNQALTFSMRYFNLGNIQFVNENQQELGSYRPREFCFDAGYSRKLSEKIGMGLALRYINSKLASGDVLGNGTNYKAASTVAADLSFYYNGLNAETGEGFTAGATLTNLGGKVSYTSDANKKDFIPANFGIGGAYTKVFDESNKMTFALDLNKLLVPSFPLDSAGREDYKTTSSISGWGQSFSDWPGASNVSVGIEYGYMNQFFVRTGYFYETKEAGDRRYFTVGAGLKYNVFGLNFSYIIPSGSGVNQNPLSNTLRFGLTFDLDPATNGSENSGGE
ncbi:type IX secretion system outer membrane channel protein PorV [Pinibacter aurantiacus]|uniref:Type IX secretion system outer membrane channel protein PorV n=1 Tax=Pinibacter aurantiacus TaxID=2851599 RepID=A0A9E2S805_9BACT|nr:type IX secretion system outer membrane channel protein PorV [Pinibacter aurantiacus]MBV4356602.1 type IX secretion system outer membrane channel protein PorV [Pinibacter aurantiacus]